MVFGAYDSYPSEDMYFPYFFSFSHVADFLLCAWIDVRENFAWDGRNIFIVDEVLQKLKNIVLIEDAKRKSIPALGKVIGLNCNYEIFAIS